MPLRKRHQDALTFQHERTQATLRARTKQLDDDQLRRLIRLCAHVQHTEGSLDGIYDNLMDRDNDITPGEAWTEQEVLDFLNSHKTLINRAEQYLIDWLSGKY